MKNQTQPQETKMQTLSIKLVEDNIKQLDELITYTDEKVAEPKKKSELKELLENLKKFLLDKKASSSRKAEIILRLPLLQITVRKA